MNIERKLEMGDVFTARTKMVEGERAPVQCGVPIGERLPLTAQKKVGRYTP